MAEAGNKNTGRKIFQEGKIRTKTGEWTGKLYVRIFRR